MVEIEPLRSIVLLHCLASLFELFDQLPVQSRWHMGRQLRRHGSLTIYSSCSCLLHSEPVSETVREFFTQPLLGLYHRASTEGAQEPLPCP